MRAPTPLDAPTPHGTTRALLGGRPEERVALASYPGLDEAAQRVLLDDEDTLVRARLARNPALPAELELTHDDVHTRRELASNPALTEAAQERLAADESSTVRTHLASNPALTPDLQRALSDDLSLTVLVELAANVALRGDAQRVLAQNAGPRRARVEPVAARRAPGGP